MAIVNSDLLSSPLSALPADVFGCIVKAVAERLRLKPPAVRVVEPRLKGGRGPRKAWQAEERDRATDAAAPDRVRAQCQAFLEARRELRTLALVPGQTVDPAYLCTDPDGALWRDAHAVFGVDPAKPGLGKLEGCTWRGNFLLLRAAFDPELCYEQYENGNHGGWFVTIGVWDDLWKAVPENVRVAEAWQKRQWKKEWKDVYGGMDSSDEEYESYDSWEERQACNDNLEVYRVSKREILALQARACNPDEPKRAKLLGHLNWGNDQILGFYENEHKYKHDGRFDTDREVFKGPRHVRRKDKSGYDLVGPSVREQEQAFVRKLEALRALFFSMGRQLKAE